MLKYRNLHFRMLSGDLKQPQHHHRLPIPPVPQRKFFLKINLVVTKYLRSLNFYRAGATDLASMILDVIDGDEHDIDWRKLFFLSSDGPNINKAVYRNLNDNLKERGFEGLAPLIVCSLHTMHNAFRKGSNVGGFGEMAEQLAFDLHAWFKVHV